MKIIVTVIPTDLVTNLLLSLTSLTNQKQESGFQQVGGLATRIYLCFLFIASRALLQIHAEFNRLL